MGSSCFGFMAFKFAYVKVIGGILLLYDTMKTIIDCIAHNCLVWTDVEYSPPANLQEMVLINPFSGGLGYVCLSLFVVGFFLAQFSL